MKRSEMIKVLDDFLYIRTPITGKEAFKLSQQLLVEIEEVGMMPPQSNVGDDGCGYYPEYEWESEDEES